jgi:hypothetical protein
MVANPLASLPSPSPLPVYALPPAMYEGQEVPPPPNFACRRQHDHPHGQVIDPLAAEVVVLDSDEDM